MLLSTVVIFKMKIEFEKPIWKIWLFVNEYFSFKSPYRINHAHKNVPETDVVIFKYI